MKFVLTLDYIFRNKDEITDDKLVGVRLFVLAGCRDKFSQAEVYGFPS